MLIRRTRARIGLKQALNEPHLMSGIGDITFVEIERDSINYCPKNSNSAFLLIIAVRSCELLPVLFICFVAQGDVRR